MQRQFLTSLVLFVGLLTPLLLVPLASIVDTRLVGAQDSTGAQYVCPSADQAMVGVWGPGRLSMLNSCQYVSGTVLKAEPELDGDLDLYVDLDPKYDQYAGSAAQLDNLHQWGSGDVLVELMPRDAGHLPPPSEGDHVNVTGAWVTDTNHGYNEIHPVWSEANDSGDVFTSGPNNGGSLPQSTAQTAAADCKNANSDPCVGYSGG